MPFHTAPATKASADSQAMPPRRGVLWWMSPGWATWIYTVLLKPAPIRALAHKVICRFIPAEIQVGEATLVLNRDDAIVSGNLALGCYETYNLELFEALLRPGMVVIDVGANIGVYSAIAAKKVGPTGQVIAIEPDPTACSFLTLTKERNAFANLTIVQKAAGATSGRTLLHLCKTNKADHRTYGDEKSRATISIEMATVDSVVAELQVPQVDVLKVDTQGFEFSVAQGMEKLLERNQEIKILMEFWPWGIVRAGGSPANLLEFFSVRGFVISLIDANKKRLVRLHTFDSILNLTLERHIANLYLERSPLPSAAE